MRHWVLLRGLAREAGHWGDFTQQLARATGDLVVAPDLPGNGLRFAEPSSTSVAALVADCRRKMPPAPRPLVLLAMSLGAMVALEWARQAPQELAGCVLVNTSVAGASPFWRRLRPRNYPTVARLLWPGTSAAARESAVLGMTTSPRLPHAGVVATWSTLAGEHPVSPMNAARQLWAAARYRIPAQRPAVPLLLLASRGDALVHPSCSVRLAQRWNADLQVHPWAGHDLPLDDPAWVLEQVTRWSRSALPLR